MTETTDTEAAQARLDELRTQAIDALTEAARISGTWGNRPDMADMVCQIVAAAAANTGGLGQFLSGRPGSWKADLLRQIVTSTTREEQQRPAHRGPQPLRLILDPEEIAYDTGVAQVAVDERAQVQARIGQMNASVVDLYEHVTAPNDPCLDTGARGHDTDVELHAPQPGVRAVTAIDDNGDPMRFTVPRGDLTAAERARLDDAEATLACLKRRQEAMTALFESDLIAYGRQLRQGAELVLAERRQSDPDVAAVPIRVVIGPDIEKPAQEWDPLLENVADEVRRRVPLTITGRTHERVQAGEKPVLLTHGDQATTPGGRTGRVAVVVEHPAGALARTIHLDIPDTTELAEYREADLTPGTVAYLDESYLPGS